MKRLFKFKYPKTLGLIIAIILAYFIFSNPKIASYVSSLNGWGYLGVFIAGLFFSFGFTTPFAVGFFITLNPESIWLAGIFGGLGAMCSDILIFKFIRFSFKDEFNRIRRSYFMRELGILSRRFIMSKIRIYLLYFLAGFVIASPLPDEVGVTLLAGVTKIKANILALISFTLNTLGIIIILWL